MNKNLSKQNLLSKLALSALCYFLFIGSAVGFTYILIQGKLIMGSKVVSGIILVGFLCLSVLMIVLLQDTAVAYMEKISLMPLKVLYHDKEIDKLEYIDGKSDWVDLRCAEEITLHKGDFALINLGISVKLPQGYEMILAPRSSTFKNYGLIQTNSIGVVDETYSSDKDIVLWPCYATRDITVHKNDRICQFRIWKHQPKLEFVEVETLGDAERGGFGSTGVQ